MEEESEQGISSFPRNSRRILIVDHDETILYLLRRFFIGHGFEVLIAKDGMEAKKRLKTGWPDIVLTDLKMPFLSGVDLIDFIHQNMKGLPIVVMTAYSHLFPDRKSEIKVDAYYVKPFDVDEMLSSIERILRG